MNTEASDPFPLDEPELTADSAPTPTAEPEDYDDVMKLIEENRRKNEAKRAAQSERNKEIEARFAARAHE